MARRSEGLSDRLKRIMYFLTAFTQKNGYAPNIREIGDNISVRSTSLIDYYLNQLEQEGYISRDKHIARSIRVVKPLVEGQNIVENLKDMLRIPVLGRIVASEPLPMPTTDLGYFDPESSVEIARSLLPVRDRTNELFALEVNGDSMIDAMVNDGDIVIMRRSDEANNGEMVAVWLDDENSTTLKYFYKENGGVRLQPANPTMGPIMVKNPDKLRIMGKVVMVIRQFKTV